METKKAGWRKVTKEDLVRGVILRMESLDRDGSFSMFTIISVRQMEDPSWPCVRVARPYAYAHEHFNSNDPLLGCEVFGIGVKDLLRDNSDMEVFQGRDGVRKMIT